MAREQPGTSARGIPRDGARAAGTSTDCSIVMEMSAAIWSALALLSVELAFISCSLLSEAMRFVSLEEQHTEQLSQQ